MFSVGFWRDALERAVKTAAQFALLGGLAEATNVVAMEWQQVAAAAGAGFVVSFATSLASAPFGEPGSPSVVVGQGAPEVMPSPSESFSLPPVSDLPPSG